MTLDIVHIVMCFGYFHILDFSTLVSSFLTLMISDCRMSFITLETQTGHGDVVKVLSKITALYEVEKACFRRSVEK